MEIVVRTLRRGEEALWRSVRRPGRRKGGRRARPRPFTRYADFVSERHLLALRDGRVVGKMEWLRTGPEGVLTDPVVVDDADVEAVAEALFAAALRTMRRRRVRKFLAVTHESNPQGDRLTPVLDRLGFRPTKRRRFHRREGRPPKALPAPAGIAFVAATGPADPRVVEAVSRASGDAPAAVAAELRALARRPFTDWRRWEVAVEGRRIVGVVLPGFLDGSGTIGTMDFVGVVPEARGRGLGRVLTVRAIRAMAALGAWTMKDATDDGNDAMVAVFRATGYRQTDVQRYFELKRPGRRRPRVTRGTARA